MKPVPLLALVVSVATAGVASAQMTLNVTVVDDTPTLSDDSGPTSGGGFYMQGQSAGVEYGMHESHGNYGVFEDTERNRGLYAGEQDQNSTDDGRASRDKDTSADSQSAD